MWPLETTSICRRIPSPGEKRRWPCLNFGHGAISQYGEGCPRSFPRRTSDRRIHSRTHGRALVVDREWQAPCFGDRRWWSLVSLGGACGCYCSGGSGDAPMLSKRRGKGTTTSSTVCSPPLREGRRKCAARWWRAKRDVRVARQGGRLV